MKFATSLSNKGIEEFIRENNKACKNEYVMHTMPRSMEESIEEKIDATESLPFFHYEIPAYQTKNGAPFVIEFDGEEYFNWAESEDGES